MFSSLNFITAITKTENLKDKGGNMKTKLFVISVFVVLFAATCFAENTWKVYESNDYGLPKLYPSQTIKQDK